MSNPVVSVSICMYNSSRYIDEALQSVFAQTFQDFEIVVVDDGSTDGCVDRIERDYPDARLTIVRQRHQGLRVARPASIAHTRGEYVAFLDHDDVWLPTKLEQQVAVGRAAPETALVFSDCLIIDEAGRTIGRLSDQYDFGSIDLRGTQGHLELLRRGCFVAYPTAFARMAAVRAVGGFNRTFQYVSDYDLWLRLARSHELKCIAEPLAKYRVHETQFTQRHSDITLAEHNALLRPVVRSASYPSGVRMAVADMLFGQHRVAFGLLLQQRRLRLAARAALGVWRYPTRVRDYCRHRLRTSAVGPALAVVYRLTVRARRAPRRLSRVLRGVLATIASGRGVSRIAQAGETAPAHVWIDGSSLGREQTGYFNLVSELIRRLARHRSPRCIVHVVTQASGRVALLARLRDDGSRVRFHRIGWRALHWSDIHRILLGRHAQLLIALVATGLMVLGTSLASPIVIAAGGVLAAGLAALLLDELTAASAEALGRRPVRWSIRALRFLWRRLPAPRGRARHENTMEVLVWRGRFRWRTSRRIAIVQDMTPRIHPELHIEGNVWEFEEFLGYVQRHAQTIVTVSEQSRRDIVDLMAVCPASVAVMPMPIHPQYVAPTFDRGFVALHGIATPYILCVGTIEPRKNLRRLVRAFGLLKDQDVAKTHALVLAGLQGWDAGFREFLVASDAHPRVRLPGFVPLEHLPSLYHFASAVICPSVYEGFGIPVMEAMCSSAIVLASRISSLPEVLGPDGLQFDPYDIEDMAGALRKALGLSPAEAAEYRRRCRQRAAAHLERLASNAPLPGLQADALVHT